MFIKREKLTFWVKLHGSEGSFRQFFLVKSKTTFFTRTTYLNIIEVFLCSKASLMKVQFDLIALSVRSIPFLVITQFPNW